MRRFQLVNTAAVTAALLLLPALGLGLWPRPMAQGVARLLPQAQLLQSFGASAGRPLPALWRQRLGSAAPRLWTRQQSTWWQFWGAHDEAGAYLVLPALSLSGVPGSSLPQPPLLVDDLAVLASDPLSRQWLAERLRTVTRPQRGLEQRCLMQLRQPQVVYWSQAGLGSLAGPVAPLLQRLQQGCLRLQLRGFSLDLAGEAAAGSGVLGDAASTDYRTSLRPLAPGTLLELQGPSLEVLLQGLLTRQLVREPLASRYGITEAQLALLRRLPFVLRLRALAQGPFQAGLELTVMPTAKDRVLWARLLAGLRQPLQQQGLQEPTPKLQSLAPRLSAGVLPSTSWSDERGATVGGWSWMLPPSGVSGPGAEPRLVLYLGPPPSAMALASVPASDAAALVLRARPSELDRLGLWPQGFPALVRTADQLDLAAGQGGIRPISQLKGRLELRRPR
ncbi:MAG: hypothetical protein VKM98_08410 [Cyanobacteriota bacterium]|nr:hypothetical protein [Cyanobacteriota bacterium]